MQSTQHMRSYFSLIASCIARGCVTTTETGATHMLTFYVPHLLYGRLSHCDTEYKHVGCLYCGYLLVLGVMYTFCTTSTQSDILLAQAYTHIFNIQVYFSLSHPLFMFHGKTKQSSLETSNARDTHSIAILKRHIQTQPTMVYQFFQRG